MFDLHLFPLSKRQQQRGKDFLKTAVFIYALCKCFYIKLKSSFPTYYGLAQRILKIWKHLKEAVCPERRKKSTMTFHLDRLHSSEPYWSANFHSKVKGCVSIGFTLENVN